MRYILVAHPVSGDGQLQPGVVVAELPEGTHLLDIQAYWTVTDPGGAFRGGAEGFKVRLEPQS